MGFRVIVDNTVMVRGLIVVIMLVVFFLCWQSSKNISMVVRHCIVTLHPYSMRFFLMNFLVEIVLSERIIEVRSVVLGPELGVCLMMTFLLILVGGLIGLWLLVPGLSLLMLLMRLFGLFLLFLFLWLWLVVINLGQVEFNFIILMIFSNRSDILFYRFSCRTKVTPN